MKGQTLAIKILLILMLMAFWPHAGPNVMAADIENCALCHKYNGLGRIDESGEKRLFYINEDLYEHSVHARVKCKGCHVKVEKFPHVDIEKVDCSTECHIVEPSVERKFSHAKDVEKYEQSVHGKYDGDKLKENAEDLPGCVYCHANRIFAPLLCTPGKPESIACEVLNRCLACHEDEGWTRTYYSHVTHRLKDRRSSYDSVELCASCHEDQEKMSRHGLEATGTYRDTLHWQSIKYNDPNAPNCINCHAPVGYLAHEIKPKSDMGSAVHKNNLVQTCSNLNGLQQCHPGATAAFAQGTIHPSGVKAKLFDTKLDTFEMKQLIEKGEIKPFKSLMDQKAQEDMTTFEYYQYLILLLIKFFYKILIGGLISFMIIHQILDFFSTRREMKKGGHH